MNAEIKKIISPDVIELKNFYPDDKTSFAFLLEFTVGIEGNEEGDDFQIEVCTPKWMLENFSENDILFGRHKLIVLKYDIEDIIRYLTHYCKTCTGNTWEEIAVKISRIAHWEFEDYRERE